MRSGQLIGVICLTCSCGGWTMAQDSNPPPSSSMKPDANPVLKHRPAESPPNPIIKENIDLTVQKGTDGKHVPIQTSVVPGSGQVIRFVTASENQKRKGVKDVVTEKEKQAKEEA